MRVTPTLTARTITSNLLKQTERLLKTEEKILSGKRLIRPSDDPVEMGNVLKYRQSLANIDQYTRNIDRGQNRAEVMETTLGMADELLERAKAIAMGSGQDPSNHTILADEVQNIRQQILDIANTKLGDTYLFSGHRTDTIPFLADGTYQGDGGSYRIMIGETVSLTLPADGSQIFTGAADIFTVLDDLETGLRTGDATLIANQVTPLQNVTDNLRRIRAEGTSKVNQMETAANHWAKMKLRFQGMLSQAEDADIASAVIELQNQEIAYEASLAAASRLLETNLVKFLG